MSKADADLGTGCNSDRFISMYMLCYLLWVEIPLAYVI